MAPLRASQASVIRKRTALPTACCALLVLVSFCCDAQAEMFVGAYGGWARSRSTDVSASTQTCLTVTCATPSTTTRSVGFRSAASAGLRAGYWLERLPLVGVAGDISFYNARGAGLDVEAIPLTVLALVRLPLFSSREFSQGRLQPYVGIGPSLVLQQATVDFRPALPSPITGWSFASGWDARAGLAIPLSSRLSLFTEWRLTQQRLEVKNTPLFNLGAHDRISTTLTTQHYLFGFALRF